MGKVSVSRKGANQSQVKGKRSNGTRFRARSRFVPGLGQISTDKWARGHQSLLRDRRFTGSAPEILSASSANGKLRSVGELCTPTSCWRVSGRNHETQGDIICRFHPRRLLKA